MNYANDLMLRKGYYTSMVINKLLRIVGIGIIIMLVWVYLETTYLGQASFDKIDSLFSAILAVSLNANMEKRNALEENLQKRD